MPMHDCSRVSAGIFHAFHNTWIGDLQKTLNADLLPSEYYALGEQRAGDFGPDVLTLHSDNERDEGTSGSESEGKNGGMVAVAEAPPSVSITQDAAEDSRFYLSRQRSVVIRHSSGDRIVALIEIVSPSNKHSSRSFDDFLNKIESGLASGIHVLIIDPQPPSRNDPDGIHGAIWDRLMAGEFALPEGSPLTLVSYEAGTPIRAYIEPTRVGSTLIDMPLFLLRDYYVPVPLESTYMQAWSGVPRRWQRVIENG